MESYNQIAFRRFCIRKEAWLIAHGGGLRPQACHMVRLPQVRTTFLSALNEARGFLAVYSELVTAHCNRSMHRSAFQRYAALLT